MVEIVAVSKNLRVAPKKVRPLTRNFRGRAAEGVLETLRFVPKKAAIPLAKVLKSAIANGHNKGVDTGKLFIKEILVDEGPSLKRIRPVSRGAAHQILKRTSQIKVVLEEK